MIDRISFTVPETKAPQLEDLTPRWGGGIKGKYKNFNVIQTTEGIFCSGSIATYLQGENVTPLNRKTIKEAIQQLESETGWNLQNAELKQLEIGATLPVSRQPSDYLNSWGIVPRFTKRTYQKQYLETIIYTTWNRSFSGYDKRQESKTIPPLFGDSELIRLELKYKKSLNKHLKRALSPWDITEKEIYMELVKRWKAFYFSIPKGREPVIDITDRITPKDIDNILKLFGYQALGDKYFSLINTLENKGIFGRVQAGRARKAIRDLSSNTRLSEPDILTQELDSKVRALTAYL